MPWERANEIPIEQWDTICPACGSRDVWIIGGPAGEFTLKCTEEDCDAWGEVG